MAVLFFIVLSTLFPAGLSFKAITKRGGGQLLLFFGLVLMLLCAEDAARGLILRSSVRRWVPLLLTFAWLRYARNRTKGNDCLPIGINAIEIVSLLT